MHKHYYQVVRSYGRYDMEYTVYEARKNEDNDIEIASVPVTLVGNHPDEIIDTLKQIAKDMKNHKPVDKSECNIFHTQLWHEDTEDYFSEDEIYTGNPDND